MSERRLELEKMKRKKGIQERRKYLRKCAIKSLKKKRTRNEWIWKVV